ncbi:MAG: hypothetical protein K0R51_1087 [Cytophagaceae bacterium]|jgi:hypothetical protein|nr:hypothetical protein [Cytophagaceae bacterium]
MKNEKKTYPLPGEKGFINPFLTEERDALWEQLEKTAIPISREDIPKHAAAFWKKKKDGSE